MQFKRNDLSFVDKNQQFMTIRIATSAQLVACQSAVQEIKGLSLGLDQCSGSQNN